MSWELKVWTPNKGTLKATYTDASPGGIVEGFRWSVRGDGNCEQMRFQAVPAKVDIAARDIVQLLVDGESAFYGYIETAWPANDGAKREYVAIGAAALLRQRRMDGASYAEQDVAAIVRDVIERLRHPAIGYDPARVPDVGAQVALLDALGVDLARLLDDLAAATAGAVRWGVDATGAFFFRAPTGAVQVEVARSLPIEADDVVSRGEVLVTTTAEGEVGGWESDGAPLGVTSFKAATARTIVAAEEQHDVYGATKLAVYPFAPPWSRRNLDATASGANVSDPGAAIDGNPDTAASTQDTSAATRLTVTAPEPSAENGGTYGVMQARITLSGDASVVVTLRLQWVYDVLGLATIVDVEATASTSIAATSSPREVTLQLPRWPRHTLLGQWARVVVDIKADSGQVNIHEVEFYELDREALKASARALIRLPTPYAGEVEADGYTSPRPYAILPWGEILSVEGWDYELTPRRWASKARIGSRGEDPLTQAIRVVADSRLSTAETTAVVLTRG